MPTVTQVVNFQHLLAQLARGANRAVHTLLMHTSTDQVPDAYPALITPYVAASAQVSAHWYHSLKPDAGFAAAPGPLPPAEALSQNAHYALSTRNPFEALSQATERHVFSTSGATIVHNADREHVRYARYASSTACAFCRVLATRTKLYTSEAAATRVVGRYGRQRHDGRPIGELYHDNCHCVAVPVRPGDDYQPPEYTAGWETDYRNARADPDTHTFDEIVNHMRRAEYGRAHPQAPQPQPEASPYGGLQQAPSVFSGLHQATP